MRLRQEIFALLEELSISILQTWLSTYLEEVRTLGIEVPF